MIELKNVSKVYGKKDQKFVALEDISFSIEPGSSIAIIGKSGSGKSTLMHVMSGLDRPTGGEVVVDGHSIAGMKQKELDSFRAEKIGFIFQAFFVQANETCAQNVSIPLEIRDMPRAARRQRIQSALRIVGLDDKINQKAKNLSGGQKQRLAIARAIVGMPSIIFADEPTGNLDSQTGKQVEDLLFDLNKKSKTTLIVVTHDEELAARCDRQITIRDGKVVSDHAADTGGEI